MLYERKVVRTLQLTQATLILERCTQPNLQCHLSIKKDIQFKALELYISQFSPFNSEICSGVWQVNFHSIDIERGPDYHKGMSIIVDAN